MRFQLIGVNHKTAPVEVRERLAIPESRLADACKKLAEHPSVAEGMIVSTCNRVEFIANMKNGTGDLREFMGEYFQVDPSQFESSTSFATTKPSGISSASPPALTRW